MIRLFGFLTALVYFGKGKRTAERREKKKIKHFWSAPNTIIYEVECGRKNWRIDFAT